MCTIGRPRGAGLCARHHLPSHRAPTIHPRRRAGEFLGTRFSPDQFARALFHSAPALEFFGKLNFLKGGILFADKITTVSERHKREIQTRVGSVWIWSCAKCAQTQCNLHGADYARWIPRRQTPPANYTQRVVGQRLCRRCASKWLRLEPKPRGPVFGMVTRVVGEKGFDILAAVARSTSSDDVRLIILGEGDPAYETALAVATRKFPKRFAYRKIYDEKSAHVSKLDRYQLIPCGQAAGLSAMTLKYGALPVRASPAESRKSSRLRSTTNSGYDFLLRIFGPTPFGTR